MPGLNHDEADRFPSGCLSSEAIDEIAAGGEPAPAQRPHLDECESCRERLSAARRDSETLARLRVAISSPISDSPGDSFEPVPLPTDLIPGYTVLEEISRGSQGVVFKAVQERTKRTVAIKMLLGGLFATEKQRARFEREIEIVASLNHPGIVTIFDSTPVKGGRYAYATKFVEGGLPVDTWSKRLTGDAKTVLRTKLSLFADVCDAVHYAHQRGVIHRDLKPSNVLIDTQSQPYVLDFGIAKVMGTPGGGTAQTLTGEIVGSPAYASPEQLSGHPDAVDVRTDVYSLGVILYEMLSGKRPHDTQNRPLAETIRDISEHDATRLGTIDRALRGDIETIAAKALERDKSRRYQTVDALAKDIRHILRNEPIEAKRDRIAYVIRKSLRKHWRVCVAVSMMLAAGLTTFVLVQTARDESAVARNRLHGARLQAEELSVRADAGSVLLQATRPPRRIGWNDPIARHSSDGLTKLRGRVDLGYLADSPLSEWATQSALAEGFRARESLSYAEMALRQAVHRAVALRGREDPATAATLGELAEVLLERKRFREAEWYCLEAIRINTVSLGTDDQRLYRDRDRLARVRLALGHFEAAERLAARDCELLDKFPLRDQSNLAASLSTWAKALKSLGKHDDAFDKALRVVQIRLATCSSTDHHLCDSLDVLADCVKCVQPTSSLQVLCDVLSSDNPATFALRLRELASTLRDRFVDTVTIGEAGADEAGTVEALNDLIMLSEHIIGADSPGTGRYYAELGVRLEEARRPREAVRAYQRALTILERHLDPKSMALANLHERLYGMFGTVGDLANAFEHINRAREIWHHQPAGDLERASEWGAGREAGKCLILSGRYSEAAALASDMLDAILRQLGRDHYLAGVYMTIRGLALCRTGSTEEGVRTARDGYRTILEAQSAPGDQRAWAGTFFASALLQSGYTTEGEQLLRTGWKDLGMAKPTPDPLRRFIAQELEHACRLRGDIWLAIHWRITASAIH